MDMRKTVLATLLSSILIISLLVVDFEYLSQSAFAEGALRYGSTGAKVKQVQTKLINWGYLKGSADGIFGSATRAAVIKFQRKNGLTPDGVVGSATLYQLGLGTTAGTSRGSITRQDERVLLAKAITGEARGEPYIGQVAVGAVIINRTKHPAFPNTIAGVIYQPGAFTAVSDGQINLPPDPSCLKAAGDALNGWDPTGGCYYYWNPATATSKWIWSRKIVKVIGKHYFGI